MTLLEQRTDGPEKEEDMTDQWNGMLTTPQGDVITRVSYAMVPGHRSFGRGAQTFGGSLPPLPGKKSPDLVRLVTEKELFSDDIPGEAILETDDGRRYRLVFRSLPTIPASLLDAIATEIAG